MVKPDKTYVINRIRERIWGTVVPSPAAELSSPVLTLRRWKDCAIVVRYDVSSPLSAL